MTQCEGTWTAFPRELPTDDYPIFVSTCSHCPEILVVYRYQAIPTGLDRHATDRDIIGAVIEYNVTMLRVEAQI